MLAVLLRNKGSMRVLEALDTQAAHTESPICAGGAGQFYTRFYTMPSLRLSGQPDGELAIVSRDPHPVMHVWEE